MAKSLDITIHAKDLKKRLKGEADITLNSEIYSLLIDAIEDYAIFSLDPNGTILTWNAGGQRLKGYRPDEAIGQNFSMFYTPEDLARRHPEEELRIARETGKYEEEGWRVKKDGSRFWASVVITALRGAEGVLRGFGKVTRDLTERKKAEDALKASHVELESRVEQRTFELAQAKIRAEKAVASRDQFFSMASHELKTPLSSLKLQAQLRKRSVLAGDLSDFAPEKLLELCEDDNRQINRLSYLVENMLDISKLTSGSFELKLEDVNLFSVLEAVLKVVEPTLNDSGNVCIVNCPETTHGQWDRTRLEQVFTNLLINCAKYAPGKPIEITAVEDGINAKIQVHDHGPGIPKEKQHRIFNPFERLNVNEATGLGLGLYIIKQIVEAHEGSVAVSSEPAEGSTFEVSLPLTHGIEGSR